MKIVGWTYWGNPQYKEMFPLDGSHTWEQREEVENIIAKELRDKGYKFTGNYHQNGDYGVPIFDNGMVYQCTQRTWGGIMVDAYPDEIDNSDGYGYLKWAWLTSEDQVVPTGEYMSGYEFLKELGKCSNASYCRHSAEDKYCVADDEIVEKCPYLKAIGKIAIFSMELTESYDEK